jgi:ABC-type lipoprotein export system ATPase subunit
MSALISVDQLVKEYGSGHGRVAALRECLDIPEASSCPSPPSGCGKSTLLASSGLTEPTSGASVVAGQDVAALSPDARSDLRLPPSASSSRASTCSRRSRRSRTCRPARVPGRSVARRAPPRGRRARRRPRADSAHDRLPSDLSGGEQQRRRSRVRS